MSGSLLLVLIKSLESNSIMVKDVQHFILKNILQLKQETRFSFIIHKTLTKLNIDLNLALGYIEKNYQGHVLYRSFDYMYI